MFGQLANVVEWIVRMAGAPAGGVNAIKVVREVLSLKARPPMVVTESGIAMLANDLHPLKVWSSMAVTESGMVMLTNERHP